MSKFNTRQTYKPMTQVTSPLITDTTPSGRTFEGAPGYARDAKSELFVLAVANMVSENTFYENSGSRDSRYEALITQVAVADPIWIAGFLKWLRSDANMRSAPLVGALEAARAMVAAKIPGARAIVDSVLQRPDEPGEALSYWVSKYGRKIPKPIKRGIADAVERLYTENALLRYDGQTKGFRFADVIDLVHPEAAAPWQGYLYRHALARRHDRVDPEALAHLPMINADAALRASFEEDPKVLYQEHLLKASGMKWETALSMGGNKLDKARLWSALIPNMGYMALLRNLRNFDEAQIPGGVKHDVMARLTDPRQVAWSKQFPFRFLSAYRHAPSLAWGHPLEVALNLSLDNVPELPGRTLVLVDRSGSMFGTISGKSELTCADHAALFGSAVALRNLGRVTLVEFGSTSKVVPVKAGDSLLRIVNERFHDLGGTNTRSAAQANYDKHDRVIVITDGQSQDGDPGSVVPGHIPMYTWNLAGYRFGSTPSGNSNRHLFAGMTDAAFQMIPILESRQNGSWPWATTAQ